MKRVRYEWTIETLDAHGDITGSQFSDTLAELVRDIETHRENGERFDLGVVRDTLDRNGEIIDRNWCYVENGELPAHFSDAWQQPNHPTPQRFAREFARVRPNPSPTPTTQPTPEPLP